MSDEFQGSSGEGSGAAPELSGAGAPDVSPGSGAAPPSQEVFSDVPPDIQATFDATFKSLDQDRPAPQGAPAPPVAPPVTPPAQVVQPQDDYAQRIQALGGFEQIEPAVQLVQRLYTPYLDENGNQVYDPESRVAQITTEPALEYLRSEDPSTFGQLAYELAMLPLNDGTGLTVGHSVLREVYGVEPETLAIAQQIQEGKLNANQYLPQTVSQEELMIVPQHLQDTYKTLSPNERQSLQNMLNDEARTNILEAYRQRTEQSQLLDQVRQSQIQAQQQAEQAHIQETENMAATYAKQSAAVVKDAFRSEIQKAFNPFGPGQDADNNRVYDQIALNTEIDMLSDPAVAMRMQQANQLALEVMRLSRSGDKYRAAQAQTKLSGDLTWLHATAMNMAKPHMEWWSQKLNAPRQAIQQRQQAAMGRREPVTGRTMATGGTNGLPKPELAGQYAQENINAILDNLGLRHT